MTHFTLVRAALWRRPLRAITAVLAFTVAVAPCIIAVSASRKAKDMQAAFDLPYVNVRSLLGGDLPLTHRFKIDNLPGVRTIDWYDYVEGDDGTGRTHYGIWGASPGYLDSIPQRALHVIDDKAMQRWRATRNGALVTKDLMSRMGWRVDQAVELKTLKGKLPVTIVGILDGFTLERVVMHYDTLNDVLKLGSGVVAFAVRCAEREPDEVAAAIDATLKDSQARTLSRSSRSFGAISFAGSPRLDFLVQQTLLLLAVGVAVSAGAVSASIRERRTELAALRAVGYSRARVMLLVVAEAELIAIAGGLVAVTPLLFLFHANGLSLGSGPLGSVTISVGTAVVAMAGSMVLGLVSGAVPMLAYGRNFSSRDLMEA